MVDYKNSKFKDIKVYELEYHLQLIKLFHHKIQMLNSNFKETLITK